MQIKKLSIFFELFINEKLIKLLSDLFRIGVYLQLILSQPHCQGHPNVLQWLQEIQPGFQQRLLGEKCSGYRKWYRGNWRIWGVTSGSHHFRCRGGKQKDQGLFHPLRWVLNLVKKCQRQEDGIIPLVHNTTKTTSSTRITVVCNSKRPKVSQSLKPRTSSSHTNVLS